MTLKIGIISLLPEMFHALEAGISGRAVEKGLIHWQIWNPRDFTTDTHHTVDDRPYGGGPGMVMKYEPLKAAIDAAKAELGQACPVIHLSPQGEPLQQAKLPNLLLNKSMVLLCSRYEGVDQRLIDQEVDMEISMGDYITSGGELPCMMLIDALIRLIPGALGHPESAQQDSFSNGLLDHPHYTRPEVINDLKVDKELLSGDHKAIARWRLKQALGRTWQKRPDLLKLRSLTQVEQALLDEYRNDLTQQDGED